MDDNVRAKVKAELPAIHRRLLAKAQLIVVQSGWREKHFKMERPTVADDLLNEAVLRVWTGKRRWVPENVDLYGMVVGVMKSIVSNEANSPANDTLSLDEPANDDGDTKGDALQACDELADELLVGEQQARILEAKMLTAAGDDPVLLAYVDALMSDVDATPAALAAHMKVRVNVVYEAQRKLRRRMASAEAKETAA